MKNGNVMGFRGYRFFSPKSSKAKYKTLGTSEANFGGKKQRIILREVRYAINTETENNNTDILVSKKIVTFYKSWIDCSVCLLAVTLNQYASE